jgi:hypothetical protein
MSSTACQTIDEMKNKLQGLAAYASNIMPPLATALEALLAAIDYEDDELIKTGLNGAFAALSETIRNIIPKIVREDEPARRELQDVLNQLGTFNAEDLDAVGKELESAINLQLAQVSRMYDTVKKLREQGYPVEEEIELGRLRNEWRQIKVRVLADWPWTTNPLPQVDRDMVARSRAAIKAGQRGEPIEDLVRRLSS